MGTYNTYGNVQIKVGTLDMKQYKIGDKVEIADGIYIGYCGAVVIKDSIFVMESRNLTDKWGQPIDCLTVLRGRGLIAEVKKEEKPPVEVETPKEDVTPKPEEKVEEPKKDEKVPEVEEQKKETPKEEIKKPEAPKEEEKKD